MSKKSNLSVKHKKDPERDQLLQEYVYGKVQPQHIETEQVIIGACMLDSSAVHRIPFLKPDHFYLEAHVLIYKAIYALYEIREPIDLLTVNHQLKKTDDLESAGGPGYLMECTNRVGSAANLEAHARIITELYLRRQGIEILSNKLKDLYDTTVDVFEARNSIADELKVLDLKSFFRLRTAEESVEAGRQEPRLNMLSGSLLHYSEICILFADTGVGKSILAVQIADAISKGEDVIDGILSNECEPMKVLFFDFELTDREFFERYSCEHTEKAYPFSDNFFRVDMNPEFIDYDDRMEGIIVKNMEDMIEVHKPEVIIVDNITFMSSEATEDTSIALKIMKKMMAFRKRYNLTILVLAHTPKRNKSNPLTINDLAGSKNLSNFATSVFALGESINDPHVRYIKQVKARGSAMQFDGSNVVKILKDKNEKSHRLEFQFLKLTYESDFLSPFMDADIQDQLIQEAYEIREKTNMSWRKLVDEVGYPNSHTDLKKKVEMYAKNIRMHELQEVKKRAESDRLTAQLDEADREFEEKQKAEGNE